MRINELQQSNTVASGNVFAIDTSNGTFKIDYDVLAAAIINKLGGDPVTIAHGGHGASTAANARTNLSVYSKSETDSAIAQSTADKAHKIFFNVATWADVYSKLSSLSAGETAPMLVGTAVVSLITDGAVPSSGLTGFVGATNLNAGRYTFFATHYSCDFSCMWEINGLTSASATPTVINFSKISTVNMVSGGYIDASTWSELWTNCLSIITQSQIGFVGIFSNSAASVLSNGKITSLVSATIWRGGLDSSRTFRVMAMSSNGQYQYSWQITSATSSSRTTGTVYRFTGTAL